MTVTTWTRGDPASLVTIEGPTQTADQGGVSFDLTGQASVVYSTHGRQLSLLSRDRGGWATSLALATDLRDMVDAQVVDDGTLIVTMSSAGGFKLFDVGSGRLVASDPGLTACYEHTTGFTSRRVGDDLILNVRTTGDSTSAAGVIRIPVGIPALRRQLCLLYSAPECSH